MIAAPPARIAGTEESGRPFWEKKKERNCSRSDADSGQRRVIKTFVAEFLVPTSAEPKPDEINQNCQCGDTLNGKSAQAFADVIGSEAGENLMGAVKNSCDDCPPKPGCHFSSLLCACSKVTSRFRDSLCESVWY